MTKTKNETQQLIRTLIGSMPKIKCKNESQKELKNLIDEHEITISAGPSGCGKSYMSIIKALDLLYKTNNSYDKIIIVTPIVEAEESLGYLKGTFEEKTFPYIYSTYYLIDQIVGKDVRNNLKSENFIQVMALAYMRSINIDNAILIFEEAQNASVRQFKTLLTRIGYNSKFIISGDIEQSDRFKTKENGLSDALERFKNVDEIAIHRFKQEDIVRNPIIGKILESYSGG